MGSQKQDVLKSRQGFTLVELLVVIGIIAVLIGILLPSLTRARQQAQLVSCQSTMRQFYNCWVMYADMHKGRTLMARYQVKDGTTEAEFGFFEGQFLGNTLKANAGGGTNDQRGKDTARVIKQVLQCPAANHDGDPDPEVAAAATGNGSPSGYYGDYVYNTFMGSRLMTAVNTLDPVSYPSLQVSRIPGNVILLMESSKPNMTQNSSGKWGEGKTPTGATYKYYFEKFTEVYGGSRQNGQPASILKLNRTGTPHVKGKKMNVLYADGAVSTVDPLKDFFENPADQRTVREYLWNAGDKYDSTPQITSHPGWKKGAFRP